MKKQLIWVFEWRKSVHYWWSYILFSPECKELTSMLDPLLYRWGVPPVVIRCVHWTMHREVLQTLDYHSEPCHHNANFYKARHNASYRTYLLKNSPSTPPALSYPRGYTGSSPQCLVIEVPQCCSDVPRHCPCRPIDHGYRRFVEPRPKHSLYSDAFPHIHWNRQRSILHHHIFGSRWIAAKTKIYKAIWHPNYAIKSQDGPSTDITQSDNKWWSHSSSNKHFSLC